MIQSSLILICKPNKPGVNYKVSTSTQRLSAQCGILNISQPYRPPRPVTGITLLTYLLRENNKQRRNKDLMEHFI
jgi:hypothetical protein